MQKGQMLQTHHFYIEFMYVDKDGYIENDHVASCVFCSIYQIESAIRYYTGLNNLRDFKVYSRKPRLFILRSRLIDKKFYIELTLFKLGDELAEMIDEYVNTRIDRQFVDSLIFYVHENILSWEQALNIFDKTFDGKFSIKDFIACDDGDYGLEFYKIVDIDTENENYIVEDFRGEISSISFNNKSYQFWEKALADKELYYKNKIIHYKNLIRTWSNF